MLVFRMQLPHVDDSVVSSGQNHLSILRHRRYADLTIVELEMHSRDFVWKAMTRACLEYVEPQ